ncbi:hypothetical protein Baya_13271 [Bagarius yarrelli]|uniref:Uncharacterized protein n=1 Tax=Bagarius yarrelli TaxID=175774 RepID=A0A556V5F4_BAGYA|nr:hypothetical protein Baya_13271 [Bagarius yarrelli]
MGRQGQLVASLLILVLMAYICEAALLGRSSAADFLRSGREKRAARCMNGGCSSESSESEEILEANSDYNEHIWAVAGVERTNAEFIYRVTRAGYEAMPGVERGSRNTSLS